MVPAAKAVPRDAPVGLERVTVKPLSASTVVSATTSMVMVLVVSPAAKETVPDGSDEPEKSAASAGLVPDPVIAHVELDVPLVSP